MQDELGASTRRRINREHFEREVARIQGDLYGLVRWHFGGANGPYWGRYNTVKDRLADLVALSREINGREG